MSFSRFLNAFGAPHVVVRQALFPCYGDGVLVVVHCYIVHFLSFSSGNQPRCIHCFSSSRDSVSVLVLGSVCIRDSAEAT